MTFTYRLAWEDEAIRCQSVVMGAQHSVDHRLVKEAVAYSLTDDDVHLLHLQLYLFYLSLDDDHYVVLTLYF
jgi:hypothetical protein